MGNQDKAAGGESKEKQWGRSQRCLIGEVIPRLCHPCQPAPGDPDLPESRDGPTIRRLSSPVGRHQLPPAGFGKLESVVGQFGAVDAFVAEGHIRPGAQAHGHGITGPQARGGCPDIVPHARQIHQRLVAMDGLLAAFQIHNVRGHDMILIRDRFRSRHRRHGPHHAAHIHILARRRDHEEGWRGLAKSQCRALPVAGGQFAHGKLPDH